MTSDRSSHPGSIALISSSLCLAYIMSLRNQFVYDDRYLILTRKLVQDLENLSEAFGGQFYRGMNYYRPLTNVSFMLDYRLWGPEPFGFHLTNTILIICTAITLYLLLFRLFGRNHTWLAALAATGFGLHPAVSSIVMAIGARSDLLSILFLLGAFLGYTQTGKIPYLASLLCFCLALLSKETAVTFPVMLLIMDLAHVSYSPHSRRFRDLVIRHAPFWALLAGYVMIRSSVLPSVTSALALDPLRFIRSYLYLLQTTLLPTFQLVYEPSMREWFSWPKMTGAAGISVIAAILWKHTDRSTRREIHFWLLWTAVTFLPTANIVTQETLFDERYLALPLIGIVVAVALLVSSSHIRERRYTLIKTVFCTLLLVLYLGMTAGRTRFWKDDLAFFTQWCRTSPTNPTAFNNLACAYKQSGDSETAMKLFRETIRLSPKNVRAYNNLGREYAAAGEFDRAIELYRKAIELNPDFAQANYNLGVAYSVMGRPDLALTLYERALKARPGYPEALCGAARACAETGRTDRAVGYYMQAMSIDPEFVPAYIGLSSIYEQEGNVSEATALLRHVLEFSPGNKKALDSLKRLLGTPPTIEHNE